MRAPEELPGMRRKEQRTAVRSDFFVESDEEEPGAAIISDTWTDHAGTVHERRPGGENTTRCGLHIGPRKHVRCVRACRTCVEENLRDFGLAHRCSPACCRP
ncbi:hypothetical protein [Saccharopolyspora taberi]